MTPWAWAKATASQMRWKARRRSGRERRPGVLVEPLAAHALHHVEDAAVGQQADVVDGHDAGVLQAGEDARLAERPLRGLPGLRHVDDLEGHLAVELPVPRQIDGAHAAAADRLHDLVGRAGEVRQVGDLAQMLERGVGEVHRRIDSQDVAGLGAELVLAGGELAQRLQDEPPELAPRRGQVVRHLVTGVRPCSAASSA